VISVRGAAETVCVGLIFQIGGGKRIRSACKTLAPANATLGNLWSIQQSRKYSLPTSFFGAVGPRTTAIKLEENALRVPVFSNANRGTDNFGEESSEIAKFFLSCK